MLKRNVVFLFFLFFIFYAQLNIIYCLAYDGEILISSEYAYKKGYTGKGVSIMISDSRVWYHERLKNKLRILGVNELLIQSEDYDNNFVFDPHGTLVAGIAVASKKEDDKFHGVAYDADIVSTDLNESNYELILNSNARIMNNSWSEVHKQITIGNKLQFYPDGRKKYEINDKDDLIERLRNNNVTFKVIKNIAKNDKLIVFAAGNYNNNNIPGTYQTVPYFYPDILKNYLVVTNLNKEDKLHLSSTSCGHTASYCVSAPGVRIYSIKAELESKNGKKLDFIKKEQYIKKQFNLTDKYNFFSGTSASAPVVSGSAAVLMQRYPYMTSDQISTVIKTTATHLGDPGINKTFGWGKINLKDAINGPKMFITSEDIPSDLYVTGSYSEREFIVNIPGINSILDKGTPIQRLCDTKECDFDLWTNDISGHGGLIKTGIGTLELAGNNSYAGPTEIKQGNLIVSGSLTSDVLVDNEGTISGSGTINSLKVEKGGKASPGKGIGTLYVSNDVIFEKDSNYDVDLGENYLSDKIQSNGKLILNGGKVNLNLEISKEILNNETTNIFLRKYNILFANKGIYGQFDELNTDYKFLNISLSYQPKDVMLFINRNSENFATLAETDNEKSLATSVEKLNDNNPIYKHFLTFKVNEDLKIATRELSGQIHSDIISTQISNTYDLHNQISNRFNYNNSSWVELLGNKKKVSGDKNSLGYQFQTYGFLIGFDKDFLNKFRLGVMGGYSNTNLNNNHDSNSRIDNYHLGVYGGKDFNNLALRLGGIYTWSNVDVNRNINYKSLSSEATSNYNATTQLLFMEFGYNIATKYFNLEPFGNLSYVNYQNNQIREKSRVAALYGDKSSSNAIFSRLGVRTNTKWEVTDNISLGLLAGISWQHEYGEPKRSNEFMFRGCSDSSFEVDSVHSPQESLILNLGIKTLINKNLSVSIGYEGKINKENQDNRLNFGINFLF